MNGNPFYLRAADSRASAIAEDKLFVNLFGKTVLNLLPKDSYDLWETPLLITSSPGGGKSTLMRIFTTTALQYICNTAQVGGRTREIYQFMESLGIVDGTRPLLVSAWLSMSNRYKEFESLESGSSLSLFRALINSRIWLNLLISLFRISRFEKLEELIKIKITLNDKADVEIVNYWRQINVTNCYDLYLLAMNKEEAILRLADDPFADERLSDYCEDDFWPTKILNNIDMRLDGEVLSFKYLVMLDDLHDLSKRQRNEIYETLLSRKMSVPVWVSTRKHALPVEYLISEDIKKEIRKGRDIVVLDLESTKNKQFEDLCIEISRLRIQNVANKFVSLTGDLNDFLASDKENAISKYLKNSEYDDLLSLVKDYIGADFKAFKNIYNQIVSSAKSTQQKAVEVCGLMIYVARERNKKQPEFKFIMPTIETFDEFFNDSSKIAASKLFVCAKYRLPYYFGLKDIIVMGNKNVERFLRIAGILFDEIMTAAILGEDSSIYLDEYRQDEMLYAESNRFYGDLLSIMDGTNVQIYLENIGKMCRAETFKYAASYAPGVSGTAIEMKDYHTCLDLAKQGKEPFKKFIRVLDVAISHNIIEPKVNMRVKNKTFLVLYINRMLCARWHLPLQKGGFREQPIDTHLRWLEGEYKVNHRVGREELWL